MITSRLVAICGAVLVALATGAVLAPPVPAQAQSRDTQIRGDSMRRHQVDNLQRENRRERAQQNRLTPEEVMAAARAQLAMTDTACDVTNAKFLGETPENTSLYEVTCAAGPGYIIQSKTPPTVTDCIILAASAQALRAQNPAAEVGSQCELPGNTDILGAIKGYAQQAAIDCIVDQGKVLGTDGNTVIYEVGCQAAQGFWIRKTGSDWSKTACIQVVAENATCEFTTPAEIATSAKALLAGTDAAACDVTQARLMGQNPTGMYYEVKCATEGEGFIARVQNNVTNRVYPCATAQQIGGGCILTQATATPAPESE